MREAPRPAPRPLATLLADAGLPGPTGGAVGSLVRGVAHDSRRAEPGTLFVAVPGTARDGAAFVADAAARGAVAVVAEGEVPAAGLPVVRVPDARRALASLAAAWWGHPGRRLRLVGITGTLGKTSVLSMLEAILGRAGVAVGTIGSLGVRYPGTSARPTPLTTPDPLVLHEALAGMAAAGVGVAAMEVTSHALVQERVHGLSYELGAFTNLVLLEHLDFHGSFRAYVAAKERFFEHLRPGAPLVHGADDPALRALVGRRWTSAVGCGAGRQAAVGIERAATGVDGTRVRLRVRRELRRVDGGTVEPIALALRLRLLGRPNVANAALAAAAALCLGADGGAVRAALAAFRAPPRRMQVVHRGRITVLDDTVGHPDSIGAVFEVAAALPHRGLHAVYAVRGRRGAEINRRDAEALAVWARRTGLAGLVVTDAAETVDAANRVEPEERAAFLGALDRHGVPRAYRPRLEDAVALALAGAADGDLVLLLGAQGMDAGAELAKRLLAADH